MYATVARNESAARLNKPSPADKNQGVILDILWLILAAAVRNSQRRKSL